MGDRVGRKYTFLITLSGMALGTGAIGLIPTFEQIGLAAAFILFGLRMIQGLVWAANTAAPSPTSPSTSRMNAAATIRYGVRCLAMAFIL
jgi:MFS family permease